MIFVKHTSLQTAMTGKTKTMPTTKNLQKYLWQPLQASNQVEKHIYNIANTLCINAINIKKSSIQETYLFVKCKPSISSATTKIS